MTGFHQKMCAIFLAGHYLLSLWPLSLHFTKDKSVGTFINLWLPNIILQMEKEKNYTFELNIAGRYRKYTGTILEDTATHITIRTVKNEEIKIKKEDISVQEWISSEGL